LFYKLQRKIKKGQKIISINVWNFGFKIFPHLNCIIIVVTLVEICLPNFSIDKNIFPKSENIK